MALLIAPIVAATGLATTAYFVDAIPMPDQLALPDSTTVYFADGTTTMATLGTENRTILTYDEMSDAVKQAIVAAEDRTFWTHAGVDLSSVLRAAWNNATGGQTQGASTITQQYARIAADLDGISYARKAREAMLAWKLNRAHSKEDILSFYLNTVPFGRGAYGIEAAAQTFFGKTVEADRSARSTGDGRRGDAARLPGQAARTGPRRSRWVPRLRPGPRWPGRRQLDHAMGVRPRGHGGSRLSEPGRGDGPGLPPHRS